MDLFTHSGSQTAEHLPLAERLRPKSLDEILGQPKILGQTSPWRKLLAQGQIPSLILWGPPGTGKTTFALLLSKEVDGEFISLNAIDTGAKALREVGESARRRRLESQRRTLVFLDEIHRLNKAQQDVLLPFVEKGDLTLVGATTENPSYELNSALLSRCRILVFERLTAVDLEALIDRACTTQTEPTENGASKGQGEGPSNKRSPTSLASDGFTSDKLLASAARTVLIDLADGDARRLLNMVDILLKLYAAQSSHDEAAQNTELDSTETGAASKKHEGSAEAFALTWPLTPETLATVLETTHLRYDKTADEHYDAVSAFIKSVRGSDPDAAVYYLARMVEGGEDPVFIARRLVILASEDIGNADPRAITVAISGLQAVELVGWPEAAISLAQVTTYLASAPKSNRAYMALLEAQEEVRRSGTLPIPLALRSAKTSAMKDLGYGKNYRYSHDSTKGYVAQTFLPREIKDKKFYEPTDHGFEKNIRQYLEWLKK